MGSIVVIERLKFAAADHKPEDQLVWEQRVHLPRRCHNFVVIQRLDLRDIVCPGADHGELLRMKLRCLLISHAVEVPDHVCSREITTIVPLHPLAQFENPAVGIGGVYGPRCGQSRSQVGNNIGTGQILEDEGIIQVVADEARAFEALIGLSDRNRHITSGHGHAEYRFSINLRECCVTDGRSGV
jgi:hypothetical protein